MEKFLPTHNPSTQLIKRVGTSLAITRKLLAKKGLTYAEQLQWWQGLSEEWQAIFLANLELDKEEFQQDLKQNLQRMFDWTEFELIWNELTDITPLSNLMNLTELEIQQLEADIVAIKESEEYQEIAQITDWDSYFADTKQQLAEQIEQMEQELKQE